VPELFRALGALAGPPEPGLRRAAELLELGPLPDETEHTELFLFQLPPYASLYLGAEGKLGGEARDRVAGFWRAVGTAPPPEPDHLTTLLGLYANLAEAARAGPDPAEAGLLGRGATALLHEHLLPWTGPYLSRVSELGHPFYRSWATLLKAAVREAARGSEHTGSLPLHLREAPDLPDPRAEGGEAFLDGLLTPVRSGMILTRADLARAASDTGLGLRAGERRYALQALFSQDAARMLGWLAGEAEAWVTRHQGLVDDTEVQIAGFWTERARHTATRLAHLARDASEAQLCDGP
jgi:TorA maturation chaperone TorD